MSRWQTSVKLFSTFCSSKRNIKKSGFLGKVWVTFICVKVRSAQFTSTYLSTFPNVFLLFPDTGPKSHSNWSLNLDFTFQHLCFGFNKFPIYFALFKSISLKTLFILKEYLNPIFPLGHEGFLESSQRTLKSSPFEIHCPLYISHYLMHCSLTALFPNLSCSTVNFFRV